MTIYDAEKGTITKIRRQTRVIYVGIGHKSSKSAQDYIQKLKEDLNLDTVFYENIFVGCRNSEEIRIEVFP